MTTQLILYNAALSHLGQRRIAAVTDRIDSRRAIDDVYSTTLAYCMEQGFWNFAMRARLLDSSSSVTPDFGYTYAFLKPTDFVRLLSLCGDEAMNVPLLQFVDEAGYWYANIDPLYAKYVSNDASYGYDLTLWPESFANYVALRLAVRVCERITGKYPPDRLLLEEKRALASARSKDAMNEPPGFPPSGTWVNSRTGGGPNRTRWDRQS